MADSIKDKAADLGHKAADAVKDMGHKIADGAEKAVDYVKDKVGMPTVQERMDVISSCGCKVGVVDHLEGGTIKLTKKDSPDGMHHFIPTAWVDHVDTHVHLNKNKTETQQGWKADAASCC